MPRENIDHENRTGTHQLSEQVRRDCEMKVQNLDVQVSVELSKSLVVYKQPMVHISLNKILHKITRWAGRISANIGPN